MKRKRCYSELLRIVEHKIILRVFKLNLNWTFFISSNRSKGNRNGIDWKRCWDQLEECWIKHSSTLCSCQWSVISIFLYSSCVVSIEFFIEFKYHQSGHGKIVDELLKNNVNINVQNKYGETPVHLAIKNVIL